MALTVFKTYAAGEVLTASDLNSSISRIHDNALSLISPLTGNLDADTNAIFFEDMTAPSTAANNGAVYVRDVGGSNLFFREESSGNQIQITNSWDMILWVQMFS